MMKAKKTSRLRKINPEWWVLLSLFGVSAVVASVPYGGNLSLFLYSAPVMIAAYVYGRRQAIMTAVACVLLVITGTFCRDLLFSTDFLASSTAQRWTELLIWAGMLLVFGWGLGRLFGDVRQTHAGFVDIMRYMVGRDNERHNYVRRLSYVAGVISEQAGLSAEQSEIIRRAALLRDIGQLELSRETYKRFSMMCQDDANTAGGPTTMHVSLGDVMDLVMAEKIYGTKYERQPTGARILALAAEYDDLTTSKKRRSALPPSVARTIIEREAGKKFDATVVRAFSRACDQGAFSSSTRRYWSAAGD